ncbi:MAG: ABC transporter permease [Blastocatellia bacterium]
MVKFRTIALLLPAAFIVLGVFLVGMLLSAANSLPLATYAQIYADPEVRAALIFTLRLTMLATALSALFGTATALLLHSLARDSYLLKTFLQIPLSVPHLAAAFILLSLIAPSGLISRFFVSTPQDFPVLVGDVFGIGILIAYVVKEMPFIALVVMATLARKGDELDLVAQNLGANAWQRFRYLTLPIIAPATLFSSLLVFAYVFGAFEIPFILGRQYPTVLAMVGNRKFAGTDLDERPEAFAIAVAMTILAAVFVWFFLRFWQRQGESEKPLLF